MFITQINDDSVLEVGICSFSIHFNTGIYALKITIIVSLQCDLRITVITRKSPFIFVFIILYINDDILYPAGIQAQDDGLEKTEIVV